MVLCISTHRPIVQYVFVSASESPRPEPIALFQASEFECIIPKYGLCKLILHCRHPIPDGGRKKLVGFLGGMEAIGIAER